jgi:hypothetical protein
MITEEEREINQGTIASTMRLKAHICGVKTDLLNFYKRLKR